MSTKAARGRSYNTAMHSYRRHRAWIARIVCCTLLLALFAPAIRHAAAQFGTQLAEVCSASGVRFVRVDGAPAPAQKAHGQHCLACCVHQAAAATGRHPDIVAPAGRVAYAIRPAVSVVTAIAPPGAAWPRAPPDGVV